MQEQISLYRAVWAIQGWFCRRKNRCLIERAFGHYEGPYIQYIMGIPLGDLVDPENYYQSPKYS